MLRAQPLLYHQQQQHLHCNLYTLKAAPRPSFTCQATRRTGKKNDLEADLAELQRLAASGGQQQQQLVDTRSSTTRLQNEAVQIRKLLANVSAKSSKLSVKQLCRFAFILSRLQQTEVNTKPLWQSVLRRLLQQSGSRGASGFSTSSTSSSSTGGSQTAASGTADSSGTTTTTTSSSPMESLLQSQAAAGDVLYLLRALAAAGPDDFEGVDDDGGLAAVVLRPGQQPSLNGIVRAVVAAASSKADSMSLKELLLSVAALAQLSFYDAHLMSAASTAFVSAVATSAAPTAATADSTASSNNNTSSSGGRSRAPVARHKQKPSHEQKQQQQQQQDELLPQVHDHQLIINYLWANASLGHCDPLLLQAALQLLLQRQLVPHISKSHLPLCMWALAALLLCQLSSQDQQQQQRQQQGQQQGQKDRLDGQQQGQVGGLQQLVEAAAVVHSMLAARAQCLWQPDGRGSTVLQGSDGCSSSSSSSSSKHTFSPDSRRQMYQAHVWLQAAGSAPPSAAPPAAAGAASSAASGVSTEEIASVSLSADEAGQAAATQVQSATAPKESPAEQQALLLSTPELVLLAKQQQQQQHLAADISVQPQQDSREETHKAGEEFWQYCGAAWQHSKCQVSGLQKQVFKALQSAALEPHMELPAQPLINHPYTQQHFTSLLQQHQQHQHQQHSSLPAADLPTDAMATSTTHTTACCDSSQAAGAEGAAVVDPPPPPVTVGFMSVDIACVMPLHLVQLARQCGLKTALQQRQQQQQRGQHVQNGDDAPGDIITNGSRPSLSSSSPAAGGAGAGASGCGTSSSSSSRIESPGGVCADKLVCVAVEVDGPTHAAVNCAGHALGATVCRNWLLQQWGWEVLVVPWWEWQGQGQGQEAG